MNNRFSVNRPPNFNPPSLNNQFTEQKIQRIQSLRNFNKQDHTDHIYYNITITPAISGAPKLAVFKEARTVALVNRASDYYLSIVRFDVPARLIPIFIMPLTDTVTNETPFSVTLVHRPTNTAYQVFLIYVAQTSLPPTDPTYTHVHTYQEFLDMANVAFATALADLKLAHVTTITEAPYLILNHETSLISLVTASNYITVDNVDIYMNHDLYAFYDPLPSFRVHNQIDGRHFRFDPEFGINNEFAFFPPGVAPGVPPPYTEIKQAYQNLEVWSSFRNLVFTTGLLPVKAESIPSQSALANPTSGSGISSQRPIITDFNPIFQNAGDSRSHIQFFPQGPYRLVDLVSEDPIINIDVSVFWQDNFNVLRPVRVPTGDNLTIKFLFVRKDFYHPVKHNI